MKKFLVLFLLSLLLLLPSCTKTLGGLNDINYGKIDYQVCGLYIRPIEVDLEEEYKMDDFNPKVYFKYTNDPYIFSTQSGSGLSYVTYQNVSRQVQLSNDKKSITVTGNAMLTFTNQDIKKVALYPIIYKDGEYKVDVDHFESVKIDTRYNYDTKFIYNNIKYDLHISLIF